MGRSRRQIYQTKYGPTALRRDRGKPGSTPEQLVMFAEQSNGPVAIQLWDRKLITYDASGEPTVNRTQVVKEVEAIKREVVSAREYPRAEFEQMAAESSGLSKRRAVNLEARTQAARVQAVYAAANAAGVKISPTDKRVLNPIQEGRYVEVVYGKQGRYDRGTLETRVRAARGTRARYSDPAQRARAQELREQLRDYRYGISA